MKQKHILATETARGTNTVIGHFLIVAVINPFSVDGTQVKAMAVCGQSIRWHRIATILVLSAYRTELVFL